ncbi:MAG: signal peptidase I [Candidatus Acidiferrum sp.]
MLSLLLPGMGQLFNRQPRKALGVAVVTHLMSAVMTHTRLLLSFPTLVTTLLVVWAWRLFVMAEAADAAASAKKPEAAVPMRWLTYSLVAVIVFLASYFPTFDHIKHESGFSAYKIPSRSMCPTLCVGDRIVADMNAYRSKPPERGDVILLKHKSTDALFVKRVIGVAGDVVQFGPGGTVLVNGQTFHPPALCGNPTGAKEEASGFVARFQTTKVAEGTFFVVGDNLENSFDSRMPEFGVVTPDMVRGKPLYFVWSPVHSRIGCSIH